MARRIALISDVHGNLEALSEVLKEIEKIKVDEIFCLGDVVGYGANPRECCRLVRENCRVVLLGNHDMAVFSPEITENFAEHARVAVDWTREQLADEDISWLKGLPYTHREDELFFSHGAPYLPEDFIYLVTWEAGYLSLKFLEMIGARAGFCGHAHITHMFSLDRTGNMIVSNQAHIDLSGHARVAINVGSVGQPRDGDARAAFGIIENHTYRKIRVPYEIKKAAGKIIEAGLPEILARRLFVGR